MTPSGVDGPLVGYSEALFVVRTSAIVTEMEVPERLSWASVEWPAVEIVVWSTDPLHCCPELSDIRRRWRATRKVRASVGVWIREGEVEPNQEAVLIEPALHLFKHPRGSTCHLRKANARLPPCDLPDRTRRPGFLGSNGAFETRTSLLLHTFRMASLALLFVRLNSCHAEMCLVEWQRGLLCAAPRIAPAGLGDSGGCGPASPCGQTAERSKCENPKAPYTCSKAAASISLPLLPKPYPTTPSS